MRSTAALALTILLVAQSAVADVYMHTPRGSNGRCDEESNNRRNANRLFNTQNNAAGGYGLDEPLDSFYYYVGSILAIEWTNQHACGTNGKTFCEVVIQMTTDEMATEDESTEGRLRNGEADPNGHNPNNNNAQGTCTNRITANNQDPLSLRNGRHESMAYYRACERRRRNGGLFTADQNVNNNNGAQATRQNPGATRYGTECQEERDYFPYWHPTPWVDIAVLTSSPERCDYYRSESENVKGRGYCDREGNNVPNNRIECEGDWKEKPSHGLSPPDCRMAPWSRDNNLGSGIDGYINTYNWTIPNIKTDRAVLRMRYNMSTADFDGWDTFFGSNGEVSPIRNNPFMYLGLRSTLRLAIDTSQFARTFPARSFTFGIREAPSSFSSCGKVYNVGVRGKRGNIAQVRNCVEYDFTPQRLHLEEGDCVHFQWTGTNYNDRNNAGNGRRKWDRSNIVQLAGLNFNRPLNHTDQTMFATEAVRRRAAFIDQDDEDMGGSGCQRQNDEIVLQPNDDQALDNCARLNARPYPYFDLGLVKFSRQGTYEYMSTRNNDYTNRAQKATIIVGESDDSVSSAQAAAIAVGTIAGAAIIGVGAVAAFKYGAFDRLRRPANKNKAEIII